MEAIEKAKQLACDPYHAIGHIVTRSHAMNLNITVDGPVVVKDDSIEVPIDVFRFSCMDSYKVKVIFNRDFTTSKRIVK
jgi:hypothetical protein